MSEVSATAMAIFGQHAVFGAKIKHKEFSRRKGGSIHNACRSETLWAEVCTDCSSMVYDLRIWWKQPISKCLAYGDISRVSRQLGRVCGVWGEAPHLEQ